MELEVNKSHKKVDLSHIKKPLIRFGAGALVSLCIFSGMYNPKAKADSEIVIPPAPVDISVEYQAPTTENTIEENIDYAVNVPENYRFSILFQVGKTEEDQIMVSDLQKIEYLNLSIEENSDLSFLHHCTNLKDLQITCLDDKAINYLSNLPTLPNLEAISLYNIFLDVELNENNIKFLENNPSIKYLELDGILLVPGVEEQLNKLETLRLGSNLNVDIDFTKLTNLKHLDLIEIEPYTLAMHFNSEEYNTLINAGVEINMDEEYKAMFLSANEKLDKIVESLGVTKESTDREKLDAILLYTLNNLTYDPTIASLSETELESTNLASEFYKNGLLYAALEKDTVICGNYTALVEALSDRLGNPTDSFYMTSNTHAWNLMNIDGELYYVDSTWLDDFAFFTEPKIAAGEGEEVSWYMEEPTSSNITLLDPSGAHIPAVNIPEYMLTHEHYKIDYDVNEVRYLASNQKVNVKVGEKETETSLGSIIGTMVAFGLAASLTNKHNNKKKDDEDKKQR